ncbi:S9 family peptidase, partial [Streptomyces sp. SID11233]|nr:S9 family peptidase [Streptomyces sp. SID11233]
GEIHVHRVSALGVERVSEGAGVHSAVRGGPLTVLSTATTDAFGTTYRVLRDGEEIARLASYAETPGLTPRPVLTTGGARGIPCAVLLPSWYREEEGPLPVLMDPYGGPHGQRVVAARNPHLTSQWFAE